MLRIILDFLKCSLLLSTGEHWQIIRSYCTIRYRSRSNLLQKWWHPELHDSKDVVECYYPILRKAMSQIFYEFYLRLNYLPFNKIKILFIFFYIFLLKT